MKTIKKYMKLHISRKLKHDHRTIKRFVADSKHIWVHADKGTLRKVSARQMHQIKRAAPKMPLHRRTQVFEAAGASGAPRTSRFRILQRFSVNA